MCVPTQQCFGPPKLVRHSETLLADIIVAISLPGSEPRSGDGVKRVRMIDVEALLEEETKVRKERNTAAQDRGDAAAATLLKATKVLKQFLFLRRYSGLERMRMSQVAVLSQH